MCKERDLYRRKLKAKEIECKNLRDKLQSLQQTKLLETHREKATCEDPLITPRKFTALTPTSQLNIAIPTEGNSDHEDQ